MIAMEKEYKEFKSLLSKTRTILIAPPQVETLDSGVSISLLYELFTKALNKPTKILVSPDYNYPERISEILGYTSFPKEVIIEKVHPLAYTITVPKVDKNTVVEYRFVDGNLQVIIKPKKGQIDLSDSKFSTEGERFDLLITVGVQSMDMLNRAFIDSKDAVSSMIVVNIDHHPLNSLFGKLNLVDTSVSTTTEVVVNIYRSFGAKLEGKNLLKAAKSIILVTDGLRRIVSSATVKTIGEMGSQLEGGIEAIFKDYYLSLSRKGLKLREEMFKRVMFNKSGEIVWAALSKDVQDSVGISSELLDGVDQLPYNICQGVKIAFLFYERTPSVWRVIALSNDKSINLFPLFNALGGRGISWFGVAEIKGDEEVVVQTVLKALGKEVTGIEEKSSKKQIKGFEQKQNMSSKKKTGTVKKLEAGSSPFQKADEEQLMEFVKSEQAKNDKTQGFGFAGYQKSPFERAPQYAAY